MSASFPFNLIHSSFIQSHSNCWLGLGRPTSVRQPNIKRPPVDSMEKTKLPCPHCGDPLEARQWGMEPYRRIEAVTPSGLILLKHSGELLLSLFQFDMNLAMNLTLLRLTLNLFLLWFLIFLGAQVLVCTICLAGRQGVRAPDKNWRDATMSADDLEDMPPKFRQHLVRRHSLMASSLEAKAMISYAKALMCPFLHSPPEQVIKLLIYLCQQVL